MTFINDGYYRLDPPNDHFNDSDEDSTLSGLRNKNNQWITFDPLFESTPEKPYDLLPAWDGYIFTMLLWNSEIVVKELEYLQCKRWMFLHQKKLRIEVEKLFQSRYRAEWEARELETASLFYDNNPDQLTGFRDSYIETINGVETIISPPLTDDQWFRAKRSFNRALPLVVDWCMNDFSYRRHNWYMGTDILLDITGVELDEEEELELMLPDEKREHIKTATKERKVREKKVINPETKKLKDIIAALKRKGKFEDVTEYM